MLKLKGAQGRAVIGMTDQFIVSAGSFALLAMAANGMSRRSVGAFGVAQTVLLLVLGLFGALYNEPALLSAGDGSVESRHVAARACGAVGQVSLLLGVVLVGVGFVIGHLVGHSLMGLGVALFPMAVQDSLRFQLLAVGRTTAALASDVVFIALWAAGIVLWDTTRNPAALLISLGVSAAIAAVVSSVALGVVLDFRGSPWRPVRERAHLVRPMMGEFVSLTLVGQASTLAVTGMIGLSASAGLRAAQALFGPVNTLTNAIRIGITPEFVRRPPVPGSRSRRGLEALNIAIAIVVMGVVVAVLLLPDSVGRQLFKDTWGPAAPLLLAIGAQRAASALYIGPLVGLRATGRSNEVMHIRVVGALALSASIVLAAWFGTVGDVAWVSAVVSLLTAFALMLRWRRPAKPTDASTQSSGLVLSGPQAAE